MRCSDCGGLIGSFEDGCICNYVSSLTLDPLDVLEIAECISDPEKLRSFLDQYNVQSVCTLLGESESEGVGISQY